MLFKQRTDRYPRERGKIMLKVRRNIGGGEDILTPIEDYFDYYYSENGWRWQERNDAWWEMQEELVEKAFNSKNEKESREVSAKYYISSFDANKIRKKYEELKNENLPFEDDIIRFISFLFGTIYFQRIGNPALSQWLNAKDINSPYAKREDENEGYSLLEATQYKYGQNAVRSQLITTLKRI